MSRWAFWGRGKFPRPIPVVCGIQGEDASEDHDAYKAVALIQEEPSRFWIVTYEGLTDDQADIAVDDGPWDYYGKVQP